MYMLVAPILCTRVFAAGLDVPDELGFSILNTIYNDQLQSIKTIWWSINEDQPRLVYWDPSVYMYRPSLYDNHLTWYIVSSFVGVAFFSGLTILCTLLRKKRPHKQEPLGVEKQEKDLLLRDEQEQESDMHKETTIHHHHSEDFI